MSKLVSALVLVAMSATALPAFANTAPDLASAPGVHAPKAGAVLLARHGADDPINHDRNDDKGGKRGKGKGRGGNDDGPRHT